MSNGNCRRTAGFCGSSVPLLVTLVFVLAGEPLAHAQQDKSDFLEVRRSSSTGLTTFVTGVNGGIISVRRPQQAVSSAAKPGTSRVRTPNVGRGVSDKLEARDFLRVYGEVFGITDQATQLVEESVSIDSMAFKHTHFKQVHHGVPVFSGELRVHQNDRGEFVAANGHFHPISKKLSATPALSLKEAIGIAAQRLESDNPGVEESVLVFVDPGWYGDAPRGVRLSYKIVLSDAALLEDAAFFVDAMTGEILDQWSLVCDLKQRIIYDADGTGEIPGSLVRAEGGAPVGSPPDADRAYDLYGDTYDFYNLAFGRDGANDHGLVMKATVNWTGRCPNAFWSSSIKQMVFCDGLVLDDVVAHEFTHGVTSFSANLIYQNQPGQLNESFSDVFGELVDLYNGGAAFVGTTGGTAWLPHATGTGQDAPNNQRSSCSDFDSGYPDGVRWLMGEDSRDPDILGALRDMWDPTCFDNPDRANSPLQVCFASNRGGVHSGSGVPNHAFAIATDGDAFNGILVTGIGPIKTGAVWYRALTAYLGMASDFEDAYYALNQSAQDLIGTFPNDPRTGFPSDSMFTADDARQIDLALQAVEMDGSGACGVHPLLDPAPPTLCPTRTTIFKDNFENGQNGWLVYATGPGQPPKWSIVGGLQDGRPGHAWFAPDFSSDACDSDETAHQQLTSPVIQLPTTLRQPMVMFTHLIQSEHFWDGGNLRIRVDEGAWDLIPSGAFTHNPYNEQMLIPNAGHPLAGLPAFTGLSGQWVTSVVDLSSFVSGAEKIQIRFEFAKDFCLGAVGWFVDDFEVFDCPVGGDCNGNGIPDEGELEAGPHQETILNQEPSYSVAYYADANGSNRESLAENFYLNRPRTVHTITLWGAFYSSGNQPQDNYKVIFHGEIGSLPGSVISSQSAVPATRLLTGRELTKYHPRPVWFVQPYDRTFSLPVWEITLTLPQPVSLNAGSHFVEIYNNTNTSSATFVWLSADFSSANSFAFSESTPGSNWELASFLGENLAIRLGGEILGEDCNSNGIPDDCESRDDCNNNGTRDICDIAAGTSDDCNADGVPNECDGDCNTNGVPDGCDIAGGTSSDCNGNVIPDECDLNSGLSEDCNSNGTLDICETDCNANGRADECDIADAVSEDCNANNKPDECEPDTDCNNNGQKDICEIFTQGKPDCDGNSQPDECQTDADGDGTIDACDGCPSDASKTSSGACGCGNAEGDSDADGTPDCTDGCPSDAAKTSSGVCGCGKPDTDSDGDTVADCVDICTNGDDLLDTDGDGTPDCLDECPNNPDLTDAGSCGCDEVDTDTDQDGRPDCIDNCPQSGNTNQTDTDSDGLGDACDGCPADARKQAPGACGCGNADVDSDGDGLLDCDDNCPQIDNANQANRDGDIAGDVCDACPDDSAKTDAGICGCGVSEFDADFDGVADCVDDCSGTIPGATVDAAGCPIASISPPDPLSGQRDSDGDGVLDVDDTCPATADGVAVDVAGCPLASEGAGQGVPGQSSNEGSDAGDGQSSAPCGVLGMVTLPLILLGWVGMKPRRRRTR